MSNSGTPPPYSFERTINAKKYEKFLNDLEEIARDFGEVDCDSLDVLTGTLSIEDGTTEYRLVDVCQPEQEPAVNRLYLHMSLNASAIHNIEEEGGESRIKGIMRLMDEIHETPELQDMKSIHGLDITNSIPSNSRTRRLLTAFIFFSLFSSRLVVDFTSNNYITYEKSFPMDSLDTVDVQSQKLVKQIMIDMKVDSLEQVQSEDLAAFLLNEDFSRKYLVDLKS